MTVNEFIEKYKRDNFDNYIKENATVDYWNDLIKTYKLEKLKFVFPESMQLTLNPLLKEGNDMFWGKEFDGFCERQIEKLEIEKQYKPQQPESIKKEPKIKGILTNETYFTILEKCTIEAFESLKLKELYPKNGAKAIWDVSTLTITKGDGLPTERDNELFRKEYILDNMRVTFLIALDRFCKDFEIKNSITREFFYKKCYQSILLKTAQSPLWHEPDFGFDINKEPCKLTFIWNMRHDIEAKSIEPKPIPQQPRPETPDLSITSAVEKIIIIKEPYGEMFSNNGFELFEHILSEHVKPINKKGRKSDLIYFYWEMYNSKTQYIHQRPESFFKWFSKKYNETTGQLKTYDNVKTDQRIKDYSTALDWFKTVKK